MTLTRAQRLLWLVVPLSAAIAFSARPVGRIVVAELYQQENPSAENHDISDSERPPDLFIEGVEKWMASNIVTNKDPLKGYTLEELEEYAENNKNKTTPKLVFDDVQDDEAPWIEPGEYAELDEESRELDTDGFTMDPEYQEAFEAYLQQQTPPDSTDSLEPRDDDELWNMVRDKGLNISNYYDPDVAEDLHRQVFALEEGYLNSSAVFRDALIDPSQAKAAGYKRRGESFRERQLDLLSKLNEKILEFDQLRETAPKCSSCWGMLVLEERRSPNPNLCIQCYEAAKTEELLDNQEGLKDNS